MRPSVELKDKVPGDSGGYDIFVLPILDGPGFCFKYLPVYTSSVSPMIQSRFLELGGSHSREGGCCQHDLPLESACDRVVELFDDYVTISHGAARKLTCSPCFVIILCILSPISSLSVRTQRQMLAGLINSSTVSAVVQPTTTISVIALSAVYKVASVTIGESALDSLSDLP